MKLSFFLSLTFVFSFLNFSKAQISKKEIIAEVNFINEKTAVDKPEVQIFQRGHGTKEREGIFIDYIQIKDEEPQIVALTSNWHLYSDNYSKTIVYLKNQIPIFIIKEKKVTLTSTDDEYLKEVRSSLAKFYIYDWGKWNYEREIIQNGDKLLENNIEKIEIEKILKEIKKK